MNVELFVIVVVLALIAAVTVWLLKKWAAKPNEWESKIPPQPAQTAPDLQTEEMKPAEMPKPPPILPPQKPRPAQEPRRK